MNARSVARELVILALSQNRFSKKELNDFEIENLLEQSVRIIQAETKDLLKQAKAELEKADNALHETSLRDNIESIKDYLNQTIESAQRAIELTHYSNEWPLLITLSTKNEVKSFAFSLLKHYKEHKKEVDEIISKSIVDWTLETMYSIDKYVIRIALIEMLYENTFHKIAIDEAVEMAKKYGTEESSGFVNGVLNRVLKTLGLEDTREK